MVGQILDETAPLRTVLVGIASAKGPPAPHNEQAAQAIREGIYPSEAELIEDVERLALVLERERVEVLRPANEPGLTQIFPRDIGFVIGRTIVQANMALEERRREWTQIEDLLGGCSSVQVDDPDARIEGGDVVLAHGRLFVGTGNRTNAAGLRWLGRRFPSWEVREVRLNPWTAENPHPQGVLHLDCAFQPVGRRWALLYRSGLRDPEVLEEIFGRDNIIPLGDEDRRKLAANVLSLSATRVVSEAGADRLNRELTARGIEVIPVAYTSVMKLGGLFRCSTLPLDRDAASG